MATKKTKQFEYQINDGEVELIKCIITSQIRKVEVPASIEKKPVTTIDGRIFMRLSDIKKDLIIPEGVKRIENFKELLSKEWNKIVYPKSIEHIDIDPNELLLNYGVIHVAPKGSYAEKVLKQLLIDGRYRLIVENEDVKTASVDIKNKRQFKYREPYDYEIEGKPTRKLGAEFIGDDKKQDTCSIPSYVNGAKLEYFFFNKIPENIKTIEVPDTITNIIGLTNHFYTAEGLEIIKIDSKNPSYWTDGKAIFSKDKKVLIRFVNHADKEYSIPKGTEVISKFAFSQVYNLEKVTIPKSVKTVEDNAFYYCENLHELEGFDDVKNVGEDVTKGCYLRDNDEIDDRIDMVIAGDKLVKCLEKTQKVIKVPEGVTEIEDEAFSFGFFSDSEDVLEEVILPDSLKIIGDNAFKTRDKIKRINLPQGLEVIGDSAFKRCKLESLIIPPKVKDINLFDLGNLPSLFIPATVENVSVSQEEERWPSTYNCIDYIEVDSNNKNYKSIDGILYSKDGKKVIYKPSALKMKKLEIPEGVEEIGDFCFGSCKVEELRIPKSVKLIGEYSFSGMFDLENVYFEEGIQLKEIKKHGFPLSPTNKLELPDGIEKIGDEAFYLRNVRKFVLPKSVKSIGRNILSGVSEIVVYDTIEPDAGDAYENVSLTDLDAKSKIGYMQLDKPDWSSATILNCDWKDYTITVKSAETDKIKYKVWMGASESASEYKCLLSSGWGKNATFAFKELDKFFSKTRDKKHKLKVAEYRLLYPVELDKDMQKKYMDYLKKNHKTPDKILKKVAIIE